MRRASIIGVHSGDELVRSVLNRVIESGGQASICKLQRPNTPIGLGDLGRCRLSGCIAPIQDDDEFQVGETLVQNASRGDREPRSVGRDRKNDGNGWHLGGYRLMGRKRSMGGVEKGPLNPLNPLIRGVDELCFGDWAGRADNPSEIPVNVRPPAP